MVPLRIRPKLTLATSNHGWTVVAHHGIIIYLNVVILITTAKVIIDKINIVMVVVIAVSVVAKAVVNMYITVVLKF